MRETDVGTSVQDKIGSRLPEFHFVKSRAQGDDSGPRCFARSDTRRNIFHNDALGRAEPQLCGCLEKWFRMGLAQRHFAGSDDLPGNWQTRGA
jgi:hypothetical protein